MVKCKKGRGIIQSIPHITNQFSNLKTQIGMELFLSPAVLSHNGFSTIPLFLYVIPAPLLRAHHLLSLFSLTASLGQMQSDQDTRAPFFCIQRH